MKIVINTRFGGFGLSEEAYARLQELGVKDPWIFYRDENRNNPLLVQVVEELGEKANGDHASLRVVEIPDDVKWEIVEYDGNEHIAEQHRKWS